MPRAPYHLDAIKVALATNGEMRAVDLANALGLKDSTLMGAVAPGLREGILVKRKDGGAVFYALAEGVEVDVAPEFNAALWADGDLVLVGVKLNDDGASLTLNPEQTDKLRRLLMGQGPES